MKNELIYQIPQDKIKEILNLNTQDFHSLKKAIGINTVEALTYNNLSTMISFLTRLGEPTPKIEKLNLKSFIVAKDQEKQLIPEIQDIPEPKKIKIYKEKKAKPIKTIKVKKVKKEIVKDPNNKRGLLGRKGRVYTAEEDRKILDYFNSDWYKNRNSKTIKNPYTMINLCADLKVADSKSIARRASILGFTNFYRLKEGQDFKEEELQILRENVGKTTTTKIQKLLKEKGYFKSIVSINVKLTRLNLSLKLNGKGDLNLRLLSESFGVDSHFFTNNEKRMKVLKPTETNKELIFSRENIKKYVIENPYDFNMGKIDNKFFIELLIGENDE